MWSLLILLLGCAKSPEAEPAPVDAQPTSSQRSDSSSCSLDKGLGTLALEVDGQRRTAVVRRGASATEQAPLLFVWHGFGAAPKLIMPAVSPQQHWEDAVVVAPQGLPRTFEKFGDKAQPGWQVSEGEYDNRDLALFDALLTELAPCIDEQRVYSTGFSNGGFFSNLLACHRPEALAAIAPVGGGGPFEPCSTAMPVLITHGTADPVVPYASAVHSMDTWSRLNRCTLASPEAQGCTTLSCDTPLKMCSFSGRHVWPSGTDARVAEFLRGHTR